MSVTLISMRYISSCSSYSGLHHWNEVKYLGSFLMSHHYFLAVLTPYCFKLLNDLTNTPQLTNIRCAAELILHNGF